MSTRKQQAGVALAAGIFLQAAALSQGGPPNPVTGTPETIRRGAVLFRQQCVNCHGLGGRGGLRGPDLTSGQWAHGGSDAELSATIANGVPGTAMPANHLTAEETREVVAFLRTVQQPAPAPGGDSARGEALFFGPAKCSHCHIVNGRGGRLGPELSSVGAARPRAYLIESIREPGRQITENHSFDVTGGFHLTLNYDLVTAVTRGGKTITGVRMNEDTFSVQLMDASERLYSLEKSTLESLRHEDRSLMPAYGADSLGDADLEDLVAYLQSLRPAPPAAGKGAVHENQ